MQEVLKGTLFSFSIYSSRNDTYIHGAFSGKLLVADISVKWKPVSLRTGECVHKKPTSRQLANTKATASQKDEHTLLLCISQEMQLAAPKSGKNNYFISFTATQ